MNKASKDNEKCKICGKDTKNLDFMAFDPATGKAYHICMECLKRATGGAGKG